MLLAEEPFAVAADGPFVAADALVAVVADGPFAVADEVVAVGQQSRIGHDSREQPWFAA